MQKAEVDGKLVPAGPDAPDVARCPSCGGEVQKRKRRRLDGGLTWFWRHRAGVGEGCRKRYSPNAS
jgi:hypothetical protein